MPFDPANKAVQRHYDTLLAQHYTWMFGVPFDEKVTEQAGLLRSLGVQNPGLAVDLGCGSGFQSIALADLGATQVHAVDTSSALLDELRTHAGLRPITTHNADLMAFDYLIDRPVDTVVCMGDTLTHLASRGTVQALFGKIPGTLKPGGKLVLSWRDLSIPPKDLDRFIPLRGTETQHMTCFLEDQRETVLVHDLIHTKQADGWALQTSCYPKLKLPLDWVWAALSANGLEVTADKTVRGLMYLCAAR